MISRNCISCVVITVIGLSLTLVQGCGEKKSGEELFGLNNNETKMSLTKWESPTDEECLAFAKKIEQLVNAGDLQGFAVQLNLDAMIERSIGDIDGVDEVRRGFIKGIQESFKESHGLGGQIISQVAEGGSYNFLRIQEKENQKRVLFRLLNPGNGGVNYHDWILGKRKDGVVCGVDMYIYLSAESLSTTLRRGFLPLAAKASKSIFEKLSSTDNDFLKHMDKFLRLTEAMQKGKSEQVLQIYRSLPASLQKDKNILLLRIHAAMNLDEKIYIAALEDFRKYHPTDPCVDMLYIDVNVCRENFVEAFACIDRLDESVGGDPYLNLMRANLKLQQEDVEAARNLATQAIEDDGSLEVGYWVLVTISLQEQQYKKTLELLNMIESKFNKELGDLTQFPDYAGFVASPQYEEWIQLHEDQ